jgi:hypothetical protein
LTKNPRTKQMAIRGDSGWLTLRQAAKLCGCSGGDLKQRIKSGQLHAFTIERAGKIKFRLSREALASAGLLAGEGTRPLLGTVDLLELIREQNQRIAALEDQRANLAGQLGVALERLHAIDQRVASLEDLPAPALANVGQRTSEHLRRSILSVLAIPASGRRWKRKES